MEVRDSSSPGNSLHDRLPPAGMKLAFVHIADFRVLLLICILSKDRTSQHLILMGSEADDLDCIVIKG